MPKTKVKLSEDQRRQRISVTSKLLGRWGVGQVGLNHDLFTFINNPEYRDAFTPGERKLLEQKHAELEAIQKTVSKIAQRHRFTKP